MGQRHSSPGRGLSNLEAGSPLSPLSPRGPGNPSSPGSPIAPAGKLQAPCSPASPWGPGKFLVAKHPAVLMINTRNRI